MVTKFVPSNLVSQNWEGKRVNEVIESYLENQWTEDDTPKKSEIRFGYLLIQNVNDVKVSLALKCLDNGQELYDKGTNYASCIYVNKVIVHLEGRLINNNFAHDYPIGLEQMRLKVQDIINSNTIALRDTEGIHKMDVEITDPVTPFRDKPNWFYLDIHVSTTRFMSRIEV